jgi:hypothetical protein
VTVKLSKDAVKGRRHWCRGPAHNKEHTGSFLVGLGFLVKREQDDIQDSGGVGVFVKSHLAPFMSVVPEHTNETTLWVKLHGIIEARPTFIGVCYAPPQSSSTYVHASAVDPFDSMAVSFATFQGSGGKVLFAAVALGSTIKCEERVRIAS